MNGAVSIPSEATPASATLIFTGEYPIRHEVDRDIPEHRSLAIFRRRHLRIPRCCASFLSVGQQVQSVYLQSSLSAACALAWIALALLPGSLRQSLLDLVIRSVNILFSVDQRARLLICVLCLEAKESTAKTLNREI